MIIFEREFEIRIVLQVFSDQSVVKLIVVITGLGTLSEFPFNLALDGRIVLVRYVDFVLVLSSEESRSNVLCDKNGNRKWFVVINVDLTADNIIILVQVLKHFVRI